MTYAPQLVAPFTTGLVLDIAPWLAPPDGFIEVDNAHFYHGRLVKRSGYRKLADNVHGRTITAFTSASPGVITVADVTGISDGTIVTLHYLAGGSFVNLSVGPYTVDNLVGFDFNLLDSNGDPVDTTGFGAFVSGVLGTYPGDRIMGLYQYIESDGTKELLCFDQTRASRYNPIIQGFEPLDTADIMSASDTQYITTVNWQASGFANRMYFTDGKIYAAGLDGIRYYDGASATTTSITPSVDGVNNLNGAKLLYAMRQRLVALFTYEGASTYPQRARWCAIQNPAEWNENTAGGGGYVDAPTGEQIVSAELLQNGLIVYFTDSVWLLSPVSDPLLPFRWSRISATAACDGKMASLNYNQQAVSIGQRGIYATSVAQTERVDQKIQLFVKNQINPIQFDKVFGLRSFSQQRSWLLYPSPTSDEADKVLILDENTGAYSTYTMPMNVLGYALAPFDYRLSDFTAANNLDITIEEAGEDTLTDYFWYEDSEWFMGGDRNGVVYILDTGDSDNGSAIPASIHTVSWAPTREQGIESRLGYVDIFITTDQLAILTIEFFKNNDDNPYATRTINCLPNLVQLALIAGATQTNPCAINAPNHGLSTGNVIYIYGVFGMLEVNDGPYTITVVDADFFTLDGIDATGYGSYTNGGAVYKNPFYRTKVWKRAYAGGTGYQHSMRISQDQDRPWIIDSFKPYYQPLGTRTIG